jgi:hypothetical protein
MKEKLSVYQQQLASLGDDLLRSEMKSHDPYKLSLNTMSLYPSTERGGEFKTDPSEGGTGRSLGTDLKPFSPLKTMRYLSQSSQKGNSAQRFPKEKPILEQMKENR